MGNVLQTDVTWYVYLRVLSTDEWVQEPLQKWTAISMEIALSRFKHEAYTFAMGSHVEYEDTKAIYLYHGTGRVAKALLDPNNCQLEIWSISIREWLSVAEQLAPNRYPLLEKSFFGKYVTQHAWLNTQTITYIKKD